jgi:phosphohistidine phosphatase
MKQLLIFRHGKSDWGSGIESDHERELAPRGIAAAESMGRFLSRAGQVPGRVVCSSATRTKLTLQHAMSAGEWDCEVSFEPRLYLAESQAVFELLQKLAPQTDSVMLVGHEPTSSEMVRLISGCALPGAGAMVRFPTATMARLDLAIETWDACEPGCGQLRWLVPPKLFTKGDFEFTC